MTLMPWCRLAQKTWNMSHWINPGGIALLIKKVSFIHFVMIKKLGIRIAGSMIPKKLMGE